MSNSVEIQPQKPSLSGMNLENSLKTLAVNGSSELANSSGLYGIKETKERLSISSETEDREPFYLNQELDELYGICLKTTV